MPLFADPSTVHGSPGWRGSGASGEHRVPFQPSPPSCDHGMHFSPRGQSFVQRSHSNATPPWSDTGMNVPGASKVELVPVAPANPSMPMGLPAFTAYVPISEHSPTTTAAAVLPCALGRV